MKARNCHPDGFALILVLFMVAIVSILLVGFVVTMRTERMAAAATVGNERAKIIAQDALEHATALLENNIPEPIPPGGSNPNPENWIISPGLLTKYSSGLNGSPGTTNYIPLSTDALDSTGTNVAIPTTDYANLNAQELSTGNYPIIPTGEPVPMSWVYILKDPTSMPGATNPIVGRYAFWMDDENAKININTAYGKTNAINLNRDNPLDQTTPVTGVDDTNPRSSDAGGFDTAIGFNSLQTNGWSANTLYHGYFPNDSVHKAGSTYATVVGNPTSAAPATAGSLLRYYPVWHPSAVNIDILPTSLSNSAAIGAKDNGGALDRNSLADWIYNKQFTTSGSVFTQNWRLFQDPAQIEQFVTSASPGPANFYQANEFNLTAYNRAPEFNVFGKPRLLLENRIQSMASVTSAPNNDSMVGNNSGSELEFYDTPDIDPLGPMYFHGDDQAYPNPSPPNGWQYGDLASVQMVGDYLSGLLAKNNWPGMPAKSFVDKWTPASGIDSSVGLREADQVAWNIVAMGNYAPCAENTANSDDWPDDRYPVFTRTTNMGAVDKSVGAFVSPSPDTSPSWSGTLSNQATAVAWYDPNRFLRVGKLSGKAIMPYCPKPYADEVSLGVEAVAVPGSSPLQIYLRMFMRVELYANRRGPPGSFWNGQFNPSFALTHFFYNISDGMGNQATQAADGNTATVAIGDKGGANSNGVTDAYIGPSGSLVLGDHTTNALVTSATKGPLVGAGSFFLAGAAANSGDTTVVFPVDSYLTMTTSRATTTTAGYAIYACSGAAMSAEPKTSPVTYPATAVKFNGSATSVRVQANARLVLYANTSNLVWEIIPVWDAVDSNLNGMAPPRGQNDSLFWDFNIDLSSVTAANTITNPAVWVRSLEISDARLGGNTSNSAGNPLWVQNAAAATVAVINPNPGGITPNPFAPTGTGVASPGDTSTPTAVNSNAASNPDDSYGYYDFQNLLYKNSPRPSIGFLSCVPTGQQRGIPDSTFVFGPSPNKNNLPDWLILDLVAPSFYDHLQNSPAPYSYLNSTMGKININANLFPAFTGSSGNVQRNLPLEALFKNMVPDAMLPGLVNNIMNHTPSTASGITGQDFGVQGQYDYIGELCEISGVADGTYPTGATTNWQKEALIRNLANLFTTQSNTFHLWGVAQAVQVVRGAGNNNNYNLNPNGNGSYLQPGDTVVPIGEKRFESVIERSVWPGVDGVPGNGHINTSTGSYDQISAAASAPLPQPFPWTSISIPYNTPVSPTPTWATFDGPDSPNLRSASYAPVPGWYQTPTWNISGNSGLLINAYNPARAHMVYKPIVFRYVTE